jgi:hypothetical protein
MNSQRLREAAASLNAFGAAFITPADELEEQMRAFGSKGPPFRRPN